MIEVEFGSATDVGCLRDLNEDAVLATSVLFAVADGMGGHAAGEVAAALALEQLGTLAGREDLRPDDVTAAIGAANDAILASTAQHEENVGMGTTISGLCLGVVGGSAHWFVFNVGDSRVYRFADGVLTRVTVDHSEVEELVASGRITAAEARTHARRNVVTRSLGAMPAPTVDMWVLPATPGDCFLVCSDGLTIEIPDDDIASILRQGLSPQLAADSLVELAREAGGRDNISVVVVQLLPTTVSGTADVATAPRASLAGGA